MESLSDLNGELLHKAYTVPSVVIRLYGQRGVTIHNAMLSGSFSRGDFHQNQITKYGLDVDVVCDAGSMASDNFRKAQDIRLDVQIEARQQAGLPDDIPVDIQFKQDDHTRESMWG